MDLAKSTQALSALHGRRCQARNNCRLLVRMVKATSRMGGLSRRPNYVDTTWPRGGKRHRLLSNGDGRGIPACGGLERGSVRAWPIGWWSDGDGS